MTDKEKHCLCSECKIICVKKNRRVENSSSPISTMAPRRGRPPIPREIEELILIAFRTNFGASLRDIAACIPTYLSKNGRERHIGHSTVVRILKKHGLWQKKMFRKEKVRNEEIKSSPHSDTIISESPKSDFGRKETENDRNVAL